jgi:hypothetical protein
LLRDSGRNRPVLGSDLQRGDRIGTGKELSATKFGDQEHDKQNF